jgi:hypothetical protein
MQRLCRLLEPLDRLSFRHTNVLLWPTLRTHDLQSCQHFHTFNHCVSRHPRRIPYLSTIAETIDVIFFNSNLPQGYASESFPLSLRPPRSPRPVFEGLNRALPSQHGLRFSTPVVGTSWTPEEVHTFVSMVRDNEASVYGYVLSHSGIHDDVMSDLLHRQGISKSMKAIQLLLTGLKKTPNIGFVSFE